MELKDKLLVALVALPLIIAFALGGTIICNYVLAEFFGPAAPQPSVLGWAGFWVIGFIIANMHVDIDWDKLSRFIAKD
jgi:hypothetical protein